jgi:hypothetical protein
MALDPELQARLIQRQKQKRIESLGNLQAAFGFGERYDPTKPWQDLQRKLKAAQPWATGLSQSEQYYFGKEFEARSDARKRAHEAVIEGWRLAAEEAREKGLAERATAALEMQKLAAEMAETQERIIRLQTGGMTPEDAAAAVAEAEGAGKAGYVPKEAVLLGQARTTPEYKSVVAFLTGAAQAGKDYNQAMAEARVKNPRVFEVMQEMGVVDLSEPQNVEKMVAKNMANKLALEYSSVAAAAPSTAGPGGADPAEIASAVGSILSAPSEIPGDRAPTLSRYFKQKNISQAEAVDLLKAAGAPSLAEMVVEERNANKVNLDEETTRRDVTIPEERDRAANAYGDLGPLERAQRQADAVAKAETEAAFQIYKPAEAAEAAVAGDEAAPGEEAPGEGGITEREQNFFNIISETQGYAPQAMHNMLKAIEDYEDLPTAQSLKGEIMGSDKFRRYMEDTGIGDPEIAFRSMNREARAAAASTRQRAQEAVRAKRQAGHYTRSDAQEILQEPPGAELPNAEQAAVDRATEDLTRLGLERSEKDAEKRALP